MQYLKSISFVQKAWKTSEHTSVSDKNQSSSQSKGFILGLVQKILVTCERVANKFLHPGANYTYMYNLHTVCKSAHVNGALVNEDKKGQKDSEEEEIYYLLGIYEKEEKKGNNDNNNRRAERTGKFWNTLTKIPLIMPKIFFSEMHILKNPGEGSWTPPSLSLSLDPHLRRRLKINCLFLATWYQLISTISIIGPTIRVRCKSLAPFLRLRR